MKDTTKNRILRVLTGEDPVPSSWSEGNGPEGYYVALKMREEARLGKAWENDEDAILAKDVPVGTIVLLYTGEKMRISIDYKDQGFDVFGNELTSLLVQDEWYKWAVISKNAWVKIHKHADPSKVIRGCTTCGVRFITQDNKLEDCICDKCKEKTLT